MIVVVSGDRKWTDYQSILTQLARLHKDRTVQKVIQGGAKGADALAKAACKELDIECIEEKARWEEEGVAAGPIRNQRMLDLYNPDVVLAFHSDIEHSKGTKDMIFRANKAGVPVILRAK